MEQLTLFDAINDKTLWYTNYCNWCEKPLPAREELEDDEIVIRAFEGQHGHLVFLGYHTNCYPQWVENDAGIDRIFKEIT